MPRKPKARRFSPSEKAAILDFLNEQLAWLDGEVLAYSKLPDILDLRILGQYEYFKNFRSGVRHLVQTISTRAVRKPGKK